MKTQDTILKFEHVVKEYPGVKALKDVSLEVKRGEIHALVGENGAGKSTLIKVCSGAIRPTKGRIVVDGKEFEYMTPASSAEQGIAVIYQEFNLVEELSVAENVFLGKPIRNGAFIDRKKMEEKTKELFREFDIDIDPSKKVKELTVGYQQMVEIAKAVHQNAKILIMDEPSAPLTVAEVDCMYDIVRKLNKQGVTIIYISHRLEEIFQLTDRTTVMRDGEKIITLNTKETDTDELIKYMVGREMTETYPEYHNYTEEEVVLSVKNATGNGVQGISLELHRGEILGLAGLVGAGRTELAELIYGAAKLEKGEILLFGKSYQPESPRKALDQGIALIPEDRKRQGALLDLTIRENATISAVQKISRFSLINSQKDKAIARDLSEKLKVKAPNLEMMVKQLSGGNQQKVIITKCLAVEPQIFIFDEPTRGIDVGAKYEIYKIMKELTEQGKAIIMISSEMPELIGMADRIIVLNEGRVTGVLAKEEFTQERIMGYASKNIRRD